MINNAVEAMEGSAKPQLTIITRASLTGDEMTISISDNGKGMTPEDRLKASAPFFTTKDYGTGLSLSICYQIVNEHGGSITAESEPGQGSTFTISLPCRKVGEECLTA